MILLKHLGRGPYGASFCSNDMIAKQSFAGRYRARPYAALGDG